MTKVYSWAFATALFFPLAFAFVNQAAMIVA
jgi:hypothetical protein